MLLSILLKIVFGAISLFIHLSYNNDSPKGNIIYYSLVLIKRKPRRGLIIVENGLTEPMRGKHYLNYYRTQHGTQ